MLGQHTDEVLKEMGLSPETIERLRREDVVS
jgi:crotonobetainyl-CoA:carnitine CoA-transferase CaiB-like acyl-CoA transferase